MTTPAHRSAVSHTDIVSGPGLALYFARPSIEGEMRPANLWEESSAEPTPTWRPRPNADPRGAADEFQAALVRTIGAAEHVAVLFSGGLDSSAILWHLLARPTFGHLRVTPIVMDMLGDDGRSAVEYARRSIDALGLVPPGLDEKLLVLPAWDPADTDDEATWWTRRGPDLRAMPSAFQRIVRQADQLGATVLLTGDGSDELLGLPRFVGPSLLRSGLHCTVRYLRDTRAAAGGFGLAMETMAALSQLLPPSTRARLYLAAGLPELSDPRPSAALAAPWRAYVADWTRAWLADLQEEHRRAGRSWAEADAYDSFFPFVDDESSRRPIPVRSPFLDAGFIEYALGLPIYCRFDPGLPSEYLRRKAVAAALLPRTALGRFPSAKQTFSTANAANIRAAAVEPVIGREIGLINPDVELARLPVAELNRVSAIERWLRGARASGARLPDAGPPALVAR
jgi:asparagine synthetase B (glutamine-hydrolysing)